MPDNPRHLRMYLPEPLCEGARQGEHNFLNLLSQVVRQAGYSVSYMARETVDLKQAAREPVYSLFHMEEPFAQSSVSIRRAYFYPFWHIERTSKRWNYEVARTPFSQDKDVHPDTDRFFGFWQKRLFQDAPKKSRNKGFILMPLQGRLLDKRSFQTCSPIRMISDTLDQVESKTVIATLHPNETYSDEEISALEKLSSLYGNFTVQLGGSENLLQTCDYVVTQNSSVAFSGFFFEKPCILFGASDFHHIAINVEKTGVGRAFEMVLAHKPSYASYVHWFLQEMCINAGRPEAPEAIRAALIRAGWPMGKE